MESSEELDSDDGMPRFKDPLEEREEREDEILMEEENGRKEREKQEEGIYTSKKMYSKIKKTKVKIGRSPSFNNTSDFEESSIVYSSMPTIPMQLVKFSKAGIEICEEAAAYLRKIKDKFGVISIAGPARTGKSLLLNLLTKKNIFEVGSRVQACTQGIWITPIQTSNKLILLMDSEGCKSVEKTGTFDAKLFSLLILMSSIFVYNSKGVIDENSISQLTLATHLSEMISFNLSESEDQESTKARISSSAPKFIWLLRDFHLLLQDLEENSISPKQYMESVLGMDKYHGRNGQKTAKIREKFLEIFEDRTCFTLPRPADQESDLERLNTLPRSSLRPKFLKAFSQIESLLLENCPLKRINGVEINGLHLLNFMEEIVKSLNEGIMPNIHTVWSEVIRKQYEQFLEDAKIIYAENREISIEQMPYEENELIYKLHLAKDKTMRGLRDMEQKDQFHEEYVKEEFDAFFQEDLKFTLDTNSSASEAFNLALIDRLFRQIIQNLNDGKYKDNFHTFESEWLNKMKEYEKQAKGPGKTIAIIEFSKKHQHSSFSKFFEDTTTNFEEEIQRLRDNHTRHLENAYERMKDEKDELINDHV